MESEEHDGQRSYSITAAGIDELGDWWDAVPGDDPPPRDELTVKVLFAISHGPERGLDVITQQRNALLVLLQGRQRATARRSSRAAEPIVDQLVRDALIVRAEADLRWLDLCEERLTARLQAPATESEPDATRERTRARGHRKGRT